jgi:hypothetical protein
MPVRQVMMCNDARLSLRLPNDCGLYDPIKDIWYIRGSELQRYRPDLFVTQDDCDEWEDE